MNTNTSNKHLTFAHNVSIKRHGILRLTPAYSAKLVNEILDSRVNPRRLLDPYCGTATTALSGGQRGLDSYTMDINPFLIWLGNAKTRNYSKKSIELSITESTKMINGLSDKNVNADMMLPDIFNIDRWWSRGALYVLSEIKRYIDYCGLDCNSIDIIKLAFCRTIISTSNAAFNHQSMSFKDEISTDTYSQSVNKSINQFKDDLEHVSSALLEDVLLPPNVILADAREVHKHISLPIDTVITSPPYPNRMSYIRELRPYMYWLGFLKESQDAADLDWIAIGGTWGSATSKAGKWKADKDYYSPSRLEIALKLIEDTNEKNSYLLANYIRKYFYDIWTHLNSLLCVLAQSYEINYIVGNSTYYGVLLDVEEVFADMMREINMGKIEVKTIRKRNSKKELYEYVVSATK